MHIPHAWLTTPPPSRLPQPCSPSRKAPEPAMATVSLGARDRHGRPGPRGRAGPGRPGRRRDALPARQQHARTRRPAWSPDALTWAETVAGGNYTHKVVARGTRIRLDGRRPARRARTSCSTTPWSRGSGSTWPTPSRSRWQAYLTTGHPLLSGDGRVLATIVADDSGQHDALCGTSTAAANQAKYGDSAPQGPSPSGRELFTLAAAKHGLTPRDLPPSVSFFKGVRGTARTAAWPSPAAPARARPSTCWPSCR